MRITESQLRRIVRRMVNEQSGYGYGYTPVAKPNPKQQVALDQFIQEWQSTGAASPETASAVIAAFGMSEAGERRFHTALMNAGMDSDESVKADISVYGPARRAMK